MNEKIKMSIKGLSIAVVLTMLATGTFPQIEWERTYVCPERNFTWICDSLSSSGKSCYFYENETRRWKVCYGGWVKLSEYVEDVNISLRTKMYQRNGSVIIAPIACAKEGDEVVCREV